MNVQSSGFLTRAMLVVAVAALIAGCGKKDDPIAKAEKKDADKPSVVAIKDTVKEAYVYAFPMLMNYGVMHAYFVDRDSGQFKAPFNTIYNDGAGVHAQGHGGRHAQQRHAVLVRRPRPARRADRAVRARRSRRAATTSCSWSTCTRSTTATSAAAPPATTPAASLIAGPDWKGETPEGVKKVFRCETEFTLVGYPHAAVRPERHRQREEGPGRLQGAAAVGVPEAARAARRAGDRLAEDRQEGHAETPIRSYLNFILQFCSAGRTGRSREAAAGEVRHSIGIEAGKPFDLAKLSEEHKAEMEAGMKDGFDEMIKQRSTTSARTSTAGGSARCFGDRAFFNGDWMLRAAGAMAGIYGNDAVEAVYPLAKQTPTASRSTAASTNYTLTFAAGELPPVNAFWSVTMYDGKTQLLIENPINRYLINSPMLPELKKNADGSLTLYIQNESPGKDKEVQLAAGAGRPDLRGDAPVLAQGGAAVGPAGR